MFSAILLAPSLHADKNQVCFARSRTTQGRQEVWGPRSLPPSCNDCRTATRGPARTPESLLRHLPGRALAVHRRQAAEQRAGLRALAERFQSGSAGERGILHLLLLLLGHGGRCRLIAQDHPASGFRQNHTGNRERKEAPHERRQLRPETFDPPYRERQPTKQLARSRLGTQGGTRMREASLASTGSGWSPAGVEPRRVWPEVWAGLS